jgi:hypothetical protein
VENDFFTQVGTTYDYRSSEGKSVRRRGYECGRKFRLDELAILLTPPIPGLFSPIAQCCIQAHNAFGVPS